MHAVTGLGRSLVIIDESTAAASYETVISTETVVGLGSMELQQCRKKRVMY